MPGASLLLALATLWVWFTPEIVPLLEWNRSEPWQWWRWFTSHFCHWTADHLVWDVLVFAVLGAWCESRSRRGFLFCLGVAAGAIVAVVTFFCPELLSYRGLSGLDSALFGWLAADLFADGIARRNRRARSVAFILAGAFMAKTAAELMAGSTLFVETQSAFVPVPVAHAVGFLGGIMSQLAAKLPVVVGARYRSAAMHSFQRGAPAKSLHRSLRAG